MFLEEVEDLKDRYPDRFCLIHVLTREPQQVELFSGRLDEERMRRFLEAVVPPETVDDWFLCGPFADGGRAAQAADRGGRLQACPARRGVPRRQRHRPRPSYPAKAGEETGAEVTITLDGRRSSFRLPKDGPVVLDAALAVRADAPYACKGGVCGTCRAKLVAGSVEMEQNWALEPEEIDDGYVLTCQSHPTSDTVVLDYDA